VKPLLQSFLDKKNKPLYFADVLLKIRKVHG